MSLSKENDENAFERALNKYLRLLQERPVITKAFTSGTVSGLGNLISQLIAPSPDGKIAWRSVCAYAGFGFVFSAPVIHHFYRLLDKLLPNQKKSTSLGILRLLIDRFVFAPPFLLIFMYCITILEGGTPDAAIEKIREFYWTLLKMNWKVWTIFQYINVNYVPMKYRVLFGNAVALVWSVYVAVKRRQAAAK